MRGAPGAATGVSPSVINASGSAIDGGVNSTASTMAKIVVPAPSVRASVRTAAAALAGERRRERNSCRRLRIIECGVRQVACHPTFIVLSMDLSWQDASAVRRRAVGIPEAGRRLVGGWWAGICEAVPATSQCRVGRRITIAISTTRRHLK